jgi:hypothetical protein
MLPKARQEKLAVEELADETLVYDLKRDTAHCLNRTAALVWRCCDGRTSVKAMADRLHRELAVPADDGMVWLALQRLEKAHLLEGQTAPPGEATRYTRREVARRLGLIGGVAALLPVVTSLVAPTPLHAQTGTVRLPNDSPCTSDTQCQSGCCRDVGSGTSRQCKPGSGGCLGS